MNSLFWALFSAIGLFLFANHILSPLFLRYLKLRDAKYDEILAIAIAVIIFSMLIVVFWIVEWVKN